MPGWLNTEISLPMSWHSEATITSLSAPAFSASVAVWQAWVSWSVANPSVMPSSRRSMSRIVSATRGWFSSVSAPMTAHCSAVDSSMRVNRVAVSVMDTIVPQASAANTVLAGTVRSSARGREGTEPPSEKVATTSIASDQPPQVAGRREVLVLVGHLHQLDLVGRHAQRSDHLVDQLLGGGGAGGHAHHAEQVVGQLVRGVDPTDPLAAGLGGQLGQRPGVRGVGRPDHDDRVAAGGQLEQRGLAVGGGEAQVAAAGHPHGREPVDRGRLHAGPVAVAERGLGQHGDGPVELGEGGDLLGGLHPVDRRRARRPSSRPPPRGPRGRRRRSGSPCPPAPSPRGGPW